MRSFTDGGTHFHLIRSDTPVSVDGFALNEPTGDIECCECGAVHENIDDIPHQSDCTQRFVHSSWYAETMASD